jgi:hypothetical protein
MTERINDLDLCDVLALASDYLDVAYMACQSLGKDDAGPLLLVLGDAGRALDKAKAEMDTRHDESPQQPRRNPDSPAVARLKAALHGRETAMDIVRVATMLAQEGAAA